MQFDLSNTSDNFQGYINTILAETLDIFVKVYLDDIQIDTQNTSKLYINQVCCVCKQIQRYSFLQIRKIDTLTKRRFGS